MNYLLENMETIIRALGYFLGFGAPVCVFCFFLFIGVPSRVLLRSPTFYVFALVGPGFVLLWYIYNAILGRLGFDSVLGLLVNLLLFCMLGGITSIVLRYFPYKDTHLRPYVMAYIEKLNYKSGERTLGLDSKPEPTEPAVSSEKTDASDASENTSLSEG
jgi:hypothetical protein